MLLLRWFAGLLLRRFDVLSFWRFVVLFVCLFWLADVCAVLWLLFDVACVVVIVGCYVDLLCCCVLGCRLVVVSVCWLVCA